MGNEMESVSPHYYQRGVVLNRPMQTMIQQPQAQQYYQTGPLSIKLKQYDLFPGQVAEGSVFLQTPTQMLLNDIYLHEGAYGAFCIQYAERLIRINISFE